MTNGARGPAPNHGRKFFKRPGVSKKAEQASNSKTSKTDAQKPSAQPAQKQPDTPYRAKDSERRQAQILGKSAEPIKTPPPRHSGDIEHNPFNVLSDLHYESGSQWGLSSTGNQSLQAYQALGILAHQYQIRGVPLDEGFQNAVQNVFDRLMLNPDVDTIKYSQAMPQILQAALQANDGMEEVTNLLRHIQANNPGATWADNPYMDQVKDALIIVKQTETPEEAEVTARATQEVRDFWASQDVLGYTDTPTAIVLPETSDDANVPTALPVDRDGLGEQSDVASGGVSVRTVDVSDLQRQARERELGQRPRRQAWTDNGDTARPSTSDRSRVQTEASVRRGVEELRSGDVGARDEVDGAENTGASTSTSNENAPEVFTDAEVELMKRNKASMSRSEELVSLISSIEKYPMWLEASEARLLFGAVQLMSQRTPGMEPVQIKFYEPHDPNKAAPLITETPESPQRGNEIHIELTDSKKKDKKTGKETTNTGGVHFQQVNRWTEMVTKRRGRRRVTIPVPRKTVINTTGDGACALHALWGKPNPSHHNFLYCEPENFKTKLQELHQWVKDNPQVADELFSDPNTGAFLSFDFICDDIFDNKVSRNKEENSQFKRFRQMYLDS